MQEVLCWALTLRRVEVVMCWNTTDAFQNLLSKRRNQNLRRAKLRLK